MFLVTLQHEMLFIDRGNFPGLYAWEILGTPIGE
jgi:hypothetical protein